MELSKEQYEHAMGFAKYAAGCVSIGGDSVEAMVPILSKALLQSASRIAALEAEIARLTESAERTTLGLLGALDGSDEAAFESASRVAALEAEVARLTEAAEKTTLGLLGTLDGSDEAYCKARDRVAALEAALREPPPPCHICKTTTDKHQLHCSAAGGPSDRILLRAMAALSPTRDGEEKK